MQNCTAFVVSGAQAVPQLPRIMSSWSYDWVYSWQEYHGRWEKKWEKNWRRSPDGEGERWRGSDGWEAYRREWGQSSDDNGRGGNWDEERGAWDSREKSRDRKEDWNDAGTEDWKYHSHDLRRRWSDDNGRGENRNDGAWERRELGDWKDSEERTNKWAGHSHDWNDAGRTREGRGLGSGYPGLSAPEWTGGPSNWTTPESVDGSISYGSSVFERQDVYSEVGMRRDSQYHGDALTDRSPLSSRGSDGCAEEPDASSEVEGFTNDRSSVSSKSVSSDADFDVYYGFRLPGPMPARPPIRLEVRAPELRCAISVSLFCHNKPFRNWDMVGMLVGD